MQASSFKPESWTDCCTHKDAVVYSHSISLVSWCFWRHLIPQRRQHPKLLPLIMNIAIRRAERCNRWILTFCTKATWIFFFFFPSRKMCYAFCSYRKKNFWFSWFNLKLSTSSDIFVYYTHTCTNKQKKIFWFTFLMVLCKWIIQKWALKSRSCSFIQNILQMLRDFWICCRRRHWAAGKLLALNEAVPYCSISNYCRT